MSEFRPRHTRWSVEELRIAREAYEQISGLHPAEETTLGSLVDGAHSYIKSKHPLWTRTNAALYARFRENKTKDELESSREVQHDCNTKVKRSIVKINFLNNQLFELRAIEQQTRLDAAAARKETQDARRREAQAMHEQQLTEREIEQLEAQLRETAGELEKERTKTQNLESAAGELGAFTSHVFMASMREEDDALTQREEAIKLEREAFDRKKQVTSRVASAVMAVTGKKALGEIANGASVKEVFRKLAPQGGMLLDSAPSPQSFRMLGSGPWVDEDVEEEATSQVCDDHVDEEQEEEMDVDEREGATASGHDDPDSDHSVDDNESLHDEEADTTEVDDVEESEQEEVDDHHPAAKGPCAPDTHQSLAPPMAGRVPHGALPAPSAPQQAGAHASTQMASASGTAQPCWTPEQIHQLRVQYQQYKGPVLKPAEFLALAPAEQSAYFKAAPVLLQLRLKNDLRQLQAQRQQAKVYFEGVRNIICIHAHEDTHSHPRTVPLGRITVVFLPTSDLNRTVIFVRSHPVPQLLAGSSRVWWAPGS